VDFREGQKSDSVYPAGIRFKADGLNAESLFWQPDWDHSRAAGSEFGGTPRAV